MREKGIVKSVEGTLCTCSVMRKSACGENCATCKATCASREHTFSARNLVGANVGDCVIIEMGTKRVLYSAFLVYILPLLAFIPGFSYIQGTGKGELESALWGLILGGAMWILVSFYGKYKKEDFVPCITEIVAE